MNNNFSRSVLNDSIYNEKIVVNKEFRNFWEAIFSRGIETYIHIKGNIITATVYNSTLRQWYISNSIPKEEQWNTVYHTNTDNVIRTLSLIMEAFIGKRTWKKLKEISHKREIILECFNGFRGLKVERILDKNKNPLFGKSFRLKGLSLDNQKNFKYLDNI